MDKKHKETPPEDHSKNGNLSVLFAYFKKLFWKTGVKMKNTQI
jgi:hypothetical protein